MSLHVPRLNLAEGEEIIWRRRANRLQSRKRFPDQKRLAAGRLIVTSLRVVFVPTLFERAIGAIGWECLREEVESVSVQEPLDGRPYFGLASWRRLLKLEVASDKECFVLRHSVHKASQELENLIVRL